MKTIIAIAITSLFFVGAEWGQSFEKAKADASTNNKYILLNFCGSDWCGPCIKLREEVFGTDEFKQFATNKLVLLKADFPRLKKNQLPKEQTTHNEMLAEKYNPKGLFPFTVLIDANGKVLKEWEGYTPKTITSLSIIRDITLAVDAKK